VKRHLVFDLDGTLCTQANPEYHNAEPIPEAIEVVNRLYDDGYTILIYTARFMGRNAWDIHMAYHDGYELTRQQLDGWGVRYHRLLMGKPPGDLVIDDRALFFTPDWPAIEKQIRERVEL
jgi:hypothetical protein